MSENELTNSPPPQSDLPDWLEQVAGSQPHEEAEPVQQRFSAFGVTAILIIVGLLFVIGYALYQRNQSTPTEGPAPAFSVMVFDADQLARRGERLNLADFRGNVVVVNFWASYCLPCRDEAPVFERVWREYRDQGVVFLGINTDDIERDAMAYMAEFDITYPNAPDQGGRIEDQYRITGIPETFVINADGEITWHIPAPASERELRAEIERALQS
jgi:cytochrome c biogenesis protein CcmG/thiol:disulfide interchange protein DsbE